MEKTAQTVQSIQSIQSIQSVQSVQEKKSGQGALLDVRSPMAEAKVRRQGPESGIPDFG